MCHPDLEPFTFNWRKGQYKPYADFEIQKKCVDFDYLLDWMEKHRDPRHKELWKSLERPEGVLEKEAPLGIPHITPDTIWSEDGVAIANLTGLESKQYCSGCSNNVLTHWKGLRLDKIYYFVEGQMEYFLLLYVS